MENSFNAVKITAETDLCVELTVVRSSALSEAEDADGIKMDPESGKFLAPNFFILKKTLNVLRVKPEFIEEAKSLSSVSWKMVDFGYITEWEIEEEEDWDGWFTDAEFT